MIRTPHPCTYPPVCYKINTGKSLIALCIVDRLDNWISSISLSHSMRQWHFYTAKTCLLCQTHELTDSLHTVCASPISSSILWKYCLRLTAYEEVHKEQRSETSRLLQTHPSSPRRGHTLVSMA